MMRVSFSHTQKSRAVFRQLCFLHMFIYALIFCAFFMSCGSSPSSVRVWTIGCQPGFLKIAAMQIGTKVSMNRGKVKE